MADPTIQFLPTPHRTKTQSGKTMFCSIGRCQARIRKAMPHDASFDTLHFQIRCIFSHTKKACRIRCIFGYKNTREKPHAGRPALTGCILSKTPKDATQICRPHKDDGGQGKRCGRLPLPCPPSSFAVRISELHFLRL